MTIAALSRLSNALNLAANAHAIPANVPIYLTEFGVQSYPNKELGVSAGQAGRIRRYRRAHRLRGPPRGGVLAVPAQRRPGGAGGRGGGTASSRGSEYVNGSLKPLFYGWPIPLTVTKQRRGVALWGLVRPATGTTKVTVLVRPKGSRRYRTLRTVTTNSLGYWSSSSSTAGEFWRVRWTSPAGVKYEGPPIRAYSGG